MTVIWGRDKMNSAIDSLKFRQKPLSENAHITSSLMASRYFRELLHSDVEEFWVLALNSAKRAIKSAMLFRGTVDACLVHPRDVFRFACVNNASSIIISHNHPSHDCQPSQADRVLTQRLVKAGKLLQLPIVDHLILTAMDCYSFADNRLI